MRGMDGVDEGKREGRAIRITILGGEDIVMRKQDSIREPDVVDDDSGGRGVWTSRSSGHIEIMDMADGCIIPCFYRKVMIHKKPLLCSTGTGPVPITDQEDTR